jgi:hypothetical protein
LASQRNFDGVDRKATSPYVVSPPTQPGQTSTISDPKDLYFWDATEMWSRIFITFDIATGAGAKRGFESGLPVAH